MEKVKIIVSIVFCFAILSAVSFTEDLKKVEEKVLSSDLYNRAPDVIPGTLPEMRNPAYWIAKMGRPDEIILTPGKIQQMNEDYQKKTHSPDPFKGVAKERIPDLGRWNPGNWWPGYVLAAPDFEIMDSKSIADTVKARMKQEIEYLRSREFGNALSVVYTGWEIDAFEDEMALDRVSDNIETRSGITVRTTRLRNVPSFSPMQVGVWQNGKTRWDLFNICVLKISQPVTVLHTSLTGEYVFIYCDEGCGWVRSEDIAFGTKEAIAKFAEPEHFVVCTGDRVMFYSDASCTYASGWFGMGDRLPLSESNMPNAIKIPVRMTNGRLITETAWLDGDADVNEGWLPYTRRNIVLTAFNLLDNPYDWTGGWYGRNHETTYRDIFACFGFKLPFHGALFTHYGSTEKVALPEMGKEKQYRMMLESEPFITLQSCGHHAQLFLGEYNGEPIVLDQHGYGYEDEEGNELQVRRCTVGTVPMVSYFLRRPITFLELK